ncbi:uncharacterized protein LOC131934848 [Physella acuta]|uniref:uncharacterized protein LOC131934848 n=1 Tax=Physella acuta TaxID=109671 RepID=UPI0027DAB7A4|nr:uncharacterized protein LOC131934848 [Physella acuta]
MSSMASNIKKAGSVLRKSFRSRNYSMFDIKENEHAHKSNGSGDSSVKTPKENFRQRTLESTSSSSGDEFDLDKPSTDQKSITLKRSKVTQSMRDAVGTIRQKLRMSTRRSRLHTTPTRVGKRRHTLGGNDVKMSSPFKIDTPSRSTRNSQKTCLSIETPTRLRREVEALTANMQALSALTPNTLHNRTRGSTRKTPPLTNGSLKTPRSIRRRITTDIF